MTDKSENEEHINSGEPFRLRDLAGRVKALSDVVVRLERKLKDKTKGITNTLDKPENQRLLIYTMIGFILGLLIGILIGRREK